MNKLKIMFLVNGLSPYRLDFFQEFGKECELTVLCERKVATDRSWKLDESKSKGFSFHVLKGVASTPDTAFCPCVVKYLSKTKYDFIIVANYNTPTGMLAIAYMRILRIPFAIECDGGLQKSGVGLKEMLKKMLISSAKWWFSPSRETDEYLLFYGAKKEQIFWYPFTSIHDTDIISDSIFEKAKQALKQEKLGDYEKLVLAVGRFIPLKYYDILIKAWRFVDQKYKLIIIGGGTEKSNYENLIQEYKLNNIELLDFLPKEQIAEYYRRADLFVHPTSTDVWGLVVNEAMAKGLPVITTNQCVAGLALLPEECLVSVGDIVTLAEKMNKVLMDTDLSYRLSQSNLQTIQAYTIENMVKVHSRIINDILFQKESKVPHKIKKAYRNILYIYGNCSKLKYEELFHDSPVMISQQAQKYHSLLIEGLSDNDATVTCISGLPINRKLTKKIFIHRQAERIDHIKYYYSGFINLPFFRQGCLFFSSFIRTLDFLKNKKNKVLICDVLSISSTCGAVLAAKLKGVKTLGIVTDIPEFLVTGKGGPNIIITKINWYLLFLFDAYVFLTKEMNEYINIFKKPFIVLEGHVDKKMCLKENVQKDKYEKKTILYAGILARRYGIEMLTKAFLHAGLEDCELHFYGDGDFVSDLKEIGKANPSIYYGGVRSNDFIVEQEGKATLLVNPRPTLEEYTKYSFPSKNMEYMASGTPVLTTKLSGMPKEYEEYVYLIEEETVEGLSNSLKEILGKPREELQRKGQRAKEFVLREKNNQVQAQKILRLIDKII